MIRLRQDSVNWLVPKLPLPLIVLTLLFLGACTAPEQTDEWRVSFIGPARPADLGLEPEGEAFRLTGGGRYLTDHKDEFTFAWKPRVEAWEWQVQLVEPSQGGLAGVMVREDTTRGARYFFAGTPGHGVLLVQVRLVKNGPTYHPSPQLFPDSVLHFALSRTSGEGGLLQMRDGTGFLRILSFPDFGRDTLLVGLALMDEDGGEAVFRELDFRDLAPPPLHLKDRISPPDTAISLPNLVIVSHRGATHGSPENSIASRDAALHCGADVIELDVRLSADGVPVLMHDETVDRTTNGSGAVSQHSWADLRQLHLRNPDGSPSPERIPDLASCLEVAGFQGYWLLDKAWDIREELVPLLRQKHLLHRCIFKGHGSAREALDFLGSFPPGDRPGYLHLLRDSVEETLLDSLLGMDILGFDVQASSEDSPLLSESFRNRLVQSDKVMMLSPFAPTFCAGQRESWHPSNSWDWSWRHGATWIQTDFPCELDLWRKTHSTHHQGTGLLLLK